MSKSLKKLIDINRLREFKNKLVGAGSAYVQTTAVDQTIAGTKTFSKPIVGSVTGSSGSCTGNAATATTATTASSVPWSGVTGKPSSYTPAAHTQAASTITGLATVATSGSYTDLSNKPTIPVIDSALSATSTNGLQNKVIKTALDGKANSSHTHTKSQITDFPALATVATSGSYNDLTNKPAIPPAYSLPDATATVKGGVKIGSNITVSKGTVSLTKANVVAALGYTPPTKDTNTWTAFKGATSSANGTAGYVPAPTKGNQAKFFKADGTWATPPNTTYASMSASEATTGTATAARTISAKVLHDKINSNLSAYATKTELNNGLATKANDSAVVHKSGNETIAGTKTFKDRVHANNGFHSTTSNVLTAQAGEYTFLLRIDSQDTYLLMSDKGGVPGTWSDARPLAIHNSTGVCNINGNAATATRATNADHATKADSATKLAAKRTIALSGAATGTATAFDGSGNITIPVTALSPSAIRAQWYAAYSDGPEAHNAMWGGRDITAYFNDGIVSANIANGTFKDIFPGDYIRRNVTIPRVLADDGTTLFAGGTYYNVNWVIADCDYWINKGDSAMTTHHVAIVPQSPLFDARMNSTNSTEGGYAGSEMYRKIIPACARGIVNAFGSSHILTFRDGISDKVKTSYVSSGIPQWIGTSGWWGVWVSVQCNLMSEKMVYGAPVCSSGAMDNTMATRQMSAFRLSEKLINYNRHAWWLRGVVSDVRFTSADADGTVNATTVSSSLGVRPFALLV